MMDGEYYFYLIRAFIYQNHTMLLSLSYAIPVILITHRFRRREAFSKTAALLVAALNFVLAGAVRYVEAYSYGSLVSSLLFVVISSVIIYFVLSLDPKKNRNRAKRTVSQVFPDAKTGAEIQSPWKIITPAKFVAPINLEGGRPTYDRPVIPRTERHANEDFHRDTAWNSSTFCCQNCGATLLDRSRFCYKCGAVIDGEPDVILNGKTVRRDDI